MPDERCLPDAGMPEEQAHAVIAYMQSKNVRQVAASLKAWRMELLNRLHRCQRQIDCLDYFLLKNKEKLL